MSILPVNIVNNENIDEIRPSTRLSDRRSDRRPGIVSVVKERRKTIGLCCDCFSSIFENQHYYFCYKCRDKLCFNCWEKNTNCPKCGRKIKKSDTWIPVKEGSCLWSCLWKCSRVFTKCFFCFHYPKNI